MTDMTLQLILVHTCQQTQNYLKDKKYTESFLHLEREAKVCLKRNSQVHLKEYPKEIQFFKKIMMKGDFNEVIQFITTFQQKLDPALYKEITLTVYKQKLYELIQNPEETELRNLFQRELVNICSEEEYQQLFTLLTCKTVRETNGMNDWTVIKGRYHCFQYISPHLENIFTQGFQSKQNEIQFTLEQAVKAYSVLLKQEQSVFEKQRRQGSTDKQSIQSMKKTDYGKRFSEAESQRNLMSEQYNKHLSSSQTPHLQSSSSKEMGESRQAKIDKEYERVSDYQKSSTFFQKKSKQPLLPTKTLQEEEYKEQTPKPSLYNMNKSKTPYSSQKLEQLENSQRQMVRPKQFQYPSSYSYLKQFHKQKHNPNDSEAYQEQIKKNIAYLDQNNSSVVYKDGQGENENFTFSNHVEQSASGFYEKQHKVLKLATVTDSKAIRTCQFSSSARYFALGTNSSILKIYDIQHLYEDGQPRDLETIYQIPQLHNKSIFCLDWSSNQKAIVTCSNDLNIKITEFPEYFGQKPHRTGVIGRHESCIRMVKLNELQNKIISCGDDSLLKVWDLGKVKKCTTLKGHKASVNAFKISENQSHSLLYSVSKDHTIKKWDLRMGQMVDSSTPQDSEITYIANNIDRIVVSHKNGMISFFTPSLQLDYSLQLHEQEIRSIDGLEYDQSLLSASFDGHVSIFHEKNPDNPNYHQHNPESEDDKVVFATFLNNPAYRGFASTSTLGICNLYSYQ